jgi:hypothetical protein
MQRGPVSISPLIIKYSSSLTFKIFKFDEDAFRAEKLRRLGPEHKQPWIALRYYLRYLRQ